MKRYLVISLLAASLLAGCGTSPFATTTSLSKSSATATSQEANGQVQIHDAFKRVDANGSVRLVVLYWVRHEDRDREFRQLILDTVPNQDRTLYPTGYRPMQMVANGQSMLNNQVTLRKIIRELGSLNYHTVTKEQQQVVALAYDIVVDYLK